MNREQLKAAAVRSNTTEEFDRALSDYLKKHHDKVIHFGGSAALTIFFTLVGGIWFDPIIVLIFAAAAAFMLGFVYEQWQRSRNIPDDGDIPVNMAGCFFGMVTFVLIHSVTITDMLRSGSLESYLR